MSLDQLIHQLALVAEMVMDVGAGGADDAGDVAEAEAVMPTQHVELAATALIRSRVLADVLLLPGRRSAAIRTSLLFTDWP